MRSTPLPGVNQPAYAMNWADLDRDGDLDLVTGSYDAGRQMETGSNYLFAAGAGVNVYLHADDGWQRQQLAESAQALAISLWDLNDDGRPDIWVGNDFDELDQVWLQTRRWRLAAGRAIRGHEPQHHGHRSRRPER